LVQVDYKASYEFSEGRFWHSIYLERITITPSRQPHLNASTSLIRCIMCSVHLLLSCRGLVMEILERNIHSGLPYSCSMIQLPKSEPVRLLNASFLFTLHYQIG
ncbi:hypothetical protein KCV06_g76, partial [Aureobasidium melanogenum]